MSLFDSFVPSRSSEKNDFLIQPAADVLSVSVGPSSSLGGFEVEDHCFLNTAGQIRSRLGKLETVPVVRLAWGVPNECSGI